MNRRRPEGLRLLAHLQQLFRYRALIQSLVARELKARYRGSVLGFFWSFVNPLLLLLIYTFVFTVVLPGARPPDARAVRALHVLRHPAVDVVLLVAARGVERADRRRQPDSQGAVSRRRCCRSSRVLAGLVHFCLGLPILAAFLHLLPACRSSPADLLWLPVIVARPARADARPGAARVGADGALPRRARPAGEPADAVVLRDADHLPAVAGAGAASGGCSNLNPFTHLAVATRKCCSCRARSREWPRLLVARRGVARACSLVGYFVFDRLRDTLAEEV